MRLRRALQLMLVVALALVLTSIGAASTASNTVPATLADDLSQGISANDLKPIECAALSLTAVLACPPNCNGTNANELILGSAGGDTIGGGGGNDCILGGGGDDRLGGGNGTDICIGGAGNDTFTPPGNPTCETRIQ